MLRMMTDDESKERDERVKFLHASKWRQDNLTAILMDIDVGGFSINEDTARVKIAAVMDSINLEKHFIKAKDTKP